LGFRNWDLGFRNWDLGIGIWELGFRIKIDNEPRLKDIKK
jgi:hypothetical protein